MNDRVPGSLNNIEIRADAILLLGLVGCLRDKDPDRFPDTMTQPAYGVTVVDTGDIDADGDGYTRADGDCDDTNADIHPEAEEVPGDKVDSNCNGEDDT